MALIHLLLCSFREHAGDSKFAASSEARKIKVIIIFHKPAMNLPPCYSREYFRDPNAQELNLTTFESKLGGPISTQVASGGPLLC